MEMKLTVQQFVKSIFTPRRMRCTMVLVEGLFLTKPKAQELNRTWANLIRAPTLPVSEAEEGKSASMVRPRNSSALTSDNFLFFVAKPRLALDSSNI